MDGGEGRGCGKEGLKVCIQEWGYGCFLFVWRKQVPPAEQREKGSGMITALGMEISSWSWLGAVGDGAE